MKKLNDFQKFWWLGLAPTVVSMMVLGGAACFKVDNLLQIEFASDFKTFKELIAPYDKALLINNHYFDFFFILCYTVLFVLSLKLISLALDFHFKKSLYLLCLLPGLLDVLENVLFLGLIENCTYYFSVYFWTVRLKWGIAVLFMQLILAILLFYLMLNGYYLVAKFLAFLRKKKESE